ncbi:hypothetical protein [Novosphingobium sp.]|uniref:hypothetical protein n=1 Tax=Novosphingobium sp. TaxID=1874826 RepID=UPI0028B11B0A|nr:hypothetical protein [Novosphingobium sp.]
MKNAFVLVDHHGDNGTVTEGMILKDVATKRFDDLVKAKLVREATADEVKKGFAPAFTSEEGEKQAATPANKAAPKPANKSA